MAVNVFYAVGALLIITLLFISKRRAPRIQRAAQIDAPASVVFSLLNDFHRWAKWSPWEKLDAEMKKTFTGPTSGVGASYAWVGNKKAGEGRMTILESKPNEQLSIKLEFFKPFAATNQATFKLTPQAGGTHVQWIMDGENAFRAKAFDLLLNMDKLVGKDFEEGLANLNTAALAAKN